MYDINISTHAYKQMKERRIQLKNKDFELIKRFITSNKMINEKIRICFNHKSFIINPSENVIITAYHGNKSLEDIKTYNL